MIGDSGSVFGRVTAKLRIDDDALEGGTSWRRSVAVGVPAIVAIGAMTAAMAQGLWPRRSRCRVRVSK